MQKLEEHRPAVAQGLHTSNEDAQANVQEGHDQPARKAPSIQ
jgi:hypothetical protein